MPIFLIIIFFVFLEIFVLIKVGAIIGATNTILALVLNAIFGATLARYQGLKVISKIQQELAQGRMPDAEMLDGLLILAGGILLVIPGFISDVIGYIFLFPLTRRLIRTLFRKKLEHMAQSGQVQVFSHFPGSDRKGQDKNIIDV
ncbi:MAG: FxsA family protein [Candidatus Omnitrophica bacterium]|nr:FxsA family protein [Candidatus Omnitrophota bacterium]